MGILIAYLLLVLVPDLYAVVVLFRYPRLRFFCFLVIGTATMMMGLPGYIALFPWDDWARMFIPVVIFFLFLTAGPLHLGFTAILTGYVIEERKRLSG